MSYKILEADKSSVFNGLVKNVEPLIQQIEINGVQYPSIKVRKFANPTTTGSFAQGKYSFVIPNSETLVNEFKVKYQLNDLTSGTACKLPGVAIHKSVKSPTSKPWFNLDDWHDSFHLWYHNLPKEAKDRFDVMVGGDAFAGGELNAPIVTPFSRWYNGFSGHVQHIPVCKITENGGLRFDIQLVTPAELLAAGAVGTFEFTEAPVLELYSYEVEPAVRQMIMNTDFQFKTVMLDIVKTEAAVANNAMALLNLHDDLKNEYRELTILVKKDSDLTTAHDYFALQQIDRQVILTLDTEKFIDLGDGTKDITHDVDYDMLMDSHQIFTDANLYRIKFDHSTGLQESQRGIYEKLVAKKFNTIRLQVKQNGAGEACHVIVLAQKHAIITIQNGRMVTLYAGM